MGRPQVPGPRAERGPLAWATAVNDSTVEWLAALSRILAVVWALIAAILLLYLCVRPSGGVALAMGFTWLYAGGMAYLGFVQLGNPEWKEKANVEAD